jgi:hypothetical protein
MHPPVVKMIAAMIVNGVTQFFMLRASRFASFTLPSLHSRKPNHLPAECMEARRFPIELSSKSHPIA